ncbi:MAG: tetratricopeptide repeat protein, partial [FCB group bacterium]|nr:tetratricopeptide repeat protein [FCB group bacterium]
MYDFRSAATQVSDEIRKVTDPVLRAFYVGMDLYENAVWEGDFEARKAKLASLRPYWDQRFKELLALSDLDDPAVWYAVATWYGIYGKRSDGGKEKHDEWLLKAAEAGHVNAMYRTALRLKRLETPEGYEAACGWLHKAANLGNVSAMISLGLMYRGGEGVPRDLPKALEWFSKAA